MEGGGLRNGTSCIAGAAHAQVDEALEIVHGLKRQLIHRVTNDKKTPGAERAAATHAHRARSAAQCSAQNPGQTAWGQRHTRAAEAFTSNVAPLLQRGPIVAHLAAGLVRVRHDIRLRGSERAQAIDGH